METHFDRWQFDNPATVVNQESHISYQDKESMQVFSHKLAPGRQLPVPVWAMRKDWLCELLVAFMENRLSIQPRGTLDERRSRIHDATLAVLPRLNSTLDKLNLEYVEAQRNGAPRKRLKELEIEIEALDTQIRISANGGLAVPTAVAYLYFSVGYSSVEVGERLGIKPPHVRELLWRMRRVWAEKFNEDGTQKPCTVAAKFDRNKAADMRRAGMYYSQIAADLGVTPNAVRYAMRKLGQTRRGARKSAQNQPCNDCQPNQRPEYHERLPKPPTDPACHAHVCARVDRESQPAA